LPIFFFRFLLRTFLSLSPPNGLTPHVNLSPPELFYSRFPFHSTSFRRHLEVFFSFSVCEIFPFSVLWPMKRISLFFSCSTGIRFMQTSPLLCSSLVALPKPTLPSSLQFLAIKAFAFLPFFPQLYSLFFAHRLSLCPPLTLFAYRNRR